MINSFSTRKVRFTKGLFLIGLVFFVQISLLVYRTVEKLFCDRYILNDFPTSTKLLNSFCYSICGEIINNSAKEKELHSTTFDPNTTIINSEFFQYLSSQLHHTPFPGIENYIHYAVAQSQHKKFNYQFGTISADLKLFFYPLKIQPCVQATSNISSLFVAIVSAPNNFENRNIIRQTWLHNLKTLSELGLLSLAGFGFIVGLTLDIDIQTRIETESEMHGDILQINMFDSYYNLTIKVVGLLNWLDDCCSQVNFVLKVDDDVYVNVKNLLTVVKSLNPSELSVYGSAADSIPLRDAGKNYISFENWPWSWYPPFIRGGAVLIPGHATRPLIVASQSIPYFPFDDVYLTGLCTSKAKIKVRFNNRFFLGIKTIYTEILEPCHVHTSVTWLTNSLDHLIKSHRTTNNFYSNISKCMYKSPEGNFKLVNSADIYNFHFSNWDSLSKTLNWIETNN